MSNIINELRIGNYISVDTDLQNDVLFEVNAQAFKAGSLKNARGVPINDTWLLNFGFTFHEAIGWNILNDNISKRINFVMDKDFEVRIVMPYFNGVMTIAKNIRYVHQLQNLYFALTQQELESDA